MYHMISYLLLICILCLSERAIFSLLRCSLATMTDKAVSTEDLCISFPRNASLEAARLEAVIKTLVENKVEALKNSKRKSSSITSSPKSLFDKLRGTSTSTVSSKDKDEAASIYSRRQDKELPRSHRRPGKRARSTPRVHGEESSEHCYCRKSANGELQIHVDDDFISLNIEDYDQMDPEEAAAMQALKRAQRRKRRRRKHKRRMKVSPVAVRVEEIKVLDDDELSQRARMAIILTAFLLLFMCLLLVGITLRMAPLIDEMVKKENEELMNSLTKDSTDEDSLHNSTASVPNVS